jgi:hypothetical protein
MGLGAMGAGPFAGGVVDCSDMAKPFKTGAGKAAYLKRAVARGGQGGKPKPWTRADGSRQEGSWLFVPWSKILREPKEARASAPRRIEQVIIPKPVKLYKN